MTMKTQNFAKKLFAVSALLALGTVAPAMFGQEPSTPPATAQQGAGMQGHEDPFAGLNLTDDQKAQVKKIHVDAKAKAEAVKADSSLSDADKKAKLMEIHKAAHMEAEKVLTPDQRAQLKEKMKERRAEKQPNNP